MRGESKAARGESTSGLPGLLGELDAVRIERSPPEQARIPASSPVTEGDGA